LGYVDVAKLKENWESGLANPVSTLLLLRLVSITFPSQGDKVSQYMTKFNRSPNQPYTTITPLTPLTDLEEFLKTNIFALGSS